ncbi:MAG TPA: DUF2334 domain-containing protein [Candidatus Acidoferrales bacterium]|nr:DUF2334 domain-containing protein [Candidatus Acidoferrales bacterium]
MTRKFIFAAIFFIYATALAGNRVLIVYEGKDSTGNPAKGDGLQLYQLLGHFDLEKTVVAADDYKAGEANKYDYLFFTGFSPNCIPPDKFLDDAYNFKGTLIWLGNGIIAMNARHDLQEKYGFFPEQLDSTTGYYAVITADRNFKFTKGDHYLTIISVTQRSKVEILANAVSPGHVTSPYAIHSGNLYLFGDSPFAFMGPTDRYLFFAEKLHDILQQEHNEFHPALIRIEDVHPMEDPDNIRKISDLLYSEGVPFLIAVVPFYIDPSDNERVALSDKPDMVDALRYAEAHGATIVMHGDTHQYHGVTASDFEFWDEAGNRPIRDDNAGYVQQKLETGIEELMRNGVYPLAWETPHYGASEVDYAAIAKVFSTTVEQRIVMNDLDYSQFFPYEIYQDMYGEKIIPENLGYVPLGTDKEERQGVQDILTAAKANLYVRDGYATAFIHPFMPINLLKEIVDGVRDLGYTYIDLRDSNNVVRLPDRSIVSGNASISCSIEDEYFKETYINEKGEHVRLDITSNRVTGDVKRNINLMPGWIYAAEPIEYREKELSLFDRIGIMVHDFWKSLFPEKKVITPAVAAIIWDSTAAGGALRDEESFVTVLNSVGVTIDTLSVSDLSAAMDYNLLIVPYSSAERLSDPLYDAIEKFVSNGGRLITDSKNPLAEDIGVNFSKSITRVEKVRDALFPEELLSWGTSETAHRIDVQESDEIVCRNAINDAPIAIARKYGKGEFISLSARFDPITDAGYSRFPYLVDWIKSYFDLYPVLQRDHIEMYFDPGLRRTTSVETLVKQWASKGVRVIDVAGWHEYPKFMYDYDRLIRLCHAYGIAVYVWIEPPQISQRFYNEHPQWHEKNYRGEDVRPDWRYPLAMTDTACLRAASDWVYSFLISHDWDGVNIAEIYFGGEGAPGNLQLLTPFGVSARELFKKKYGFDPVQLFQQASPHYYKTAPQDWTSFVDFRASLVTELTSHFLSLATGAFQNKPGAQIILTILDQKTFPDLRASIGVDADQIVQLRQKYDFALQVEDPQSNWNTDPRRYVGIGNTYRRLLGPDSSDLMIDLNVYSMRDSSYTGVFPSKTPTGTESYLLVNSAAKVAPRVTIYDEATVLPQDLADFPYAISPQANMQITDGGYEIDAPYSTSIRLSAGTKYIIVDGETVFPYQPGYFAIPAGKHLIKIHEAQVNPFQDETMDSHIEAASCNILSERTLQRGVEFTYESPARCAVSFGKMPFAVFVDDHETPFSVAREEQHYGIILPAGQHKVLVILENAVSYGIDITSLWSSALITIFGSFAGGILVVLYFIYKVRRRRAFARV